MYKVSLGQYLGQNFMNRSFHNASLIFFATEIGVKIVLKRNEIEINLEMKQ